MCLTGHVRNEILFIGRGLAYRKTEETDLCWTSYGRNTVMLIERGVAYRKTNKTDLCWSARVETGVMFIGGVWRTAKRDSTRYCSSPPSTSSSLHGLLFIHRRPPPASTGSCSSSLHRMLLHRLLFNHPSTGTPPPSTVHPALHGVVLFIQPSTPRGPVHSRQRHRSLFIQPPCNAHCSSREAASIGFS